MKKKKEKDEEKQDRHKSTDCGVTMQEAESVNRACTEWLRKRKLLYDHEAIKSFLFDSPPL